MVPSNNAFESLMSKRAAAILLAGGTAALWPLDAQAQKIPWIVLPLAAAPIVAVVLCAILGVATKSWAVGLGNTALVAVWVGWFVAASKYSSSDLMVWAPIAALGVHSIVMASRIVLNYFGKSS